MNIKEFLSASDILVDVRASDKTQLLQELARRAAASLNLAAETGQPRVIALKHEKYFNAVLVGLDEEQATTACLALRRSGAYCIKLTPSELNDPDAVWRG